MENDYYKELDFILEELKAEYKHLFKGVEFFPEESSATTKEKVSKRVRDKFGLKEWELNVLYYTLLLDKNIKSIDPLSLTLEGVIFINKGGYTQKSIAIKNEKLRLLNIENDFKRYSFLLMVFTAIVAMGTIVSAWYFAIEIWKYYIG